MIQSINQFNCTILLNILIIYEHIDLGIYIIITSTNLSDKH